LSAAAYLLIAGCAPDELYVQMADPHRRHPIGVTAETAALEVAVPPDGVAVPANQFFDVAKFARRYKAEGRGPLVVAVPHRARHSRTASESVRTVRTIVAQAGINPSRVRYYGKPNGIDGAETITLTYDRIAAVAPKCGDWSESVVRNPENLPYRNYGCATQRNLAVMVANPTDLLYPAPETPRMGERREVTYKTWNETPPKTELNVSTK
jgi:pilus assembly protein CpaD